MHPFLFILIFLGTFVHEMSFAKDPDTQGNTSYSQECKIAFNSDIVKNTGYGNKLICVKSSNPNTPYRLTMYYEITCGHCAAFKQSETFKEIYRKFVKSGRIKICFRDLAFNPQAIFGIKASWCFGPQTYLEISQRLLNNQGSWISMDVEKTKQSIVNFIMNTPQEFKDSKGKVTSTTLSKKFNLRLDTLEKCLNDNNFLRAIVCKVQYNHDKYKFDGVPAFVLKKQVNGKEEEMVLSVSDMNSDYLESALKQLDAKLPS